MVKVKATTILETVIAMVIILIVFLIAGTIFLNISKSGLTEKKIKAEEVINAYFDKLQINEVPYEEQEEDNDFTVITKITEYPGRAGIVLVYCSAIDQENKFIAAQKRLVQINNK